MLTLYGEAASDPAHVAVRCAERPCEEVFCLPWATTKQEAADSLRLNRGRPCRVFPCEPNREKLDFGELPCRVVPTDDKREGDVMARVGFLASKGVSVLNQVMATPCRSDFYGNVLEMGEGAPGYIVSVDDMDRYFPTAPLSAKHYAATTVFVEMEGTEDFEEVAGVRRAPVMFATPFMPGSQVFMGFFRRMSRKGAVGSFRPHEHKSRGGVTLFRYNEGYRIPNDAYEVLLREGKC